MELPPLGEGLGRGFRRFGEGLLLAAVFVPAKAGLFERPEAAFFTVVVDGVMHRMTVGMVETTRRKTRFPTVGTTIHAKAKPPSATRLFVFMSSPLASAINNGENAKKKPPSNGSPIPTFPKGKERHPTISNTAGMDSRPLGRVGEGPLFLPPRPLNHLADMLGEMSIGR